MKVLIAIGALAFTVTASAAIAQTAGEVASPIDRQFAGDAAASNAFEITSSQLALRKSRDPAVRNMARWMIQSHTLAGRKLQAAARNLDDEGGAVPAAAPGLARREGPAAHVLTSIEFLSGGTKVLETPLVPADVVSVPNRDAVAFQFDVPLDQLKPGNYICQVNVIDDAGGAFAFPRQAVRVLGSAAAAPATGKTAGGSVGAPQ